MTPQDKKQLYRAGKVEGGAEVGLVLAILTIWYGLELPPTSWWTVGILAVVSLVGVWYGVRIKQGFLDRTSGE